MPIDMRTFIKNRQAFPLEELAKYDVLFLNYKDTAKGKPETRWSDDNKKAFAAAVEGGKGLVVYVAQTN